MYQGIKNWHLSILVGITSIISIALIQQYAEAQWNDPIGLPGETSGFRLVVNPMKEDLFLNGYDLVDSNLRIDANGPNAIQVNNNSKICFNETSDCIASWSEISGGLWNQNGNKIYYNNGNVGIGTTNPRAHLQIEGAEGNADTNYPIVDGSVDLRLVNNTGEDSRILFQGYSGNIDDFAIKWSGNNPGAYSNWLEFWGGRANGGRPVMTMQRDYSPDNSQWSGVGIGVEENEQINTTLRVKNHSTEDILQLYDDSNEVLSVADGGAINIGGGTDHNGFKLAINNGPGNSAALKFNPGWIWAYQTGLNLEASNDVYLNPGVGNGVGVDVADPQQILHVKNSAGFSDSLLRLENNQAGAFSNQTTQIEFVRGPDWHTDYSWIGPTNTSTFDIWTMENVPILFGIGGGERMRLNPEGNLSTVGTIKPGDYDATLTCLADDYGSIVWNDACATNGCLQVCTQVGWLDIATN